MAKLTISDAARVAGVARSTLHRAIRAGRLSADPDGQLDTAELLRAGYTLQRSTHQAKVVALQDATLRATGAQQISMPVETHEIPLLHQERELLRLERDLLRRELEAAHTREQAALERERVAREREALLLRMLEQAQQQSQRLLEAPRSAPVAPVSDPHPNPLPSGEGTDRGAMRRRIVALLREHPDGLTTAELRVQLQADKPLGHTVIAMARDGLLRKVGPGRYTAA